ncbi:MAG: polysaccharide biosynthesis tyrosine autokinase [Anaerolineaceae bacterium]|nr:polysaccharide biosynthesis tyrosine autokinase [Anaerolineaceae bacterium]
MELKTYLAILSRQKWVFVGAFLLCMAATVAVAQIVPPNYTATSRLRVMTPISGSSSYVDFNIYYATRLMNTYVAMATSTSVLEELKNKLHIQDNPDISAVVVPDSEIIKISAQDRDPDRSAQMVNTLADLLVTHSQTPAVEEQTSAETILSQRLEEVSNRLAQAQQEYDALTGPYSEYSAQVTSLNNDIAKNQQLYIALKDRYNQALIQPIQSTKAAGFVQQIADLKTLLDQEQKDLEAFNIKLTNTTERLLVTRNEIQTSKQEYSELTNQLDQARISGAMQGKAPTLTIIDKAMPPRSPSGPGIMIIYTLGAVISIFIAALAAFTINNLDDRLFSNDRMSELIHSPLLGRVPATKHLKSSLFSDDHHYFKESVHRLRVNIWKVAKEKSLKSIIISSPEPKEGKTTLTASIARDLAETGHRVIIIDADMRLPSIHTLFGISNWDGLTNVLAGEISLESAIQEGNVENLFILTAGHGPTNSNNRFNSPRMSQIMDQLKGQFDLILLDTPSILAVSDVEELISLTDGVILVVQHGHTRERDIRSALRQLTNLNANILGYVENRSEKAYSSHYYVPARNASN